MAENGLKIFAEGADKEPLDFFKGDENLRLKEIVNS